MPSPHPHPKKDSRQEVLESRYLRRSANKDGGSSGYESAAQMYRRVAETIARHAEGKGRDVSKWARIFADLMISGRFLPNSPTLMNAGKVGGQLSACFVLPLGNSLTEIFDTLKHAALIHQSGGGTGFAFSRLQGKGDVSGPVSFLRVFDAATEAIKQGGVRRGANMAVLRVDHPDIEEFISCKQDLKSIQNFNISVGATADYMRAVSENASITLRDPVTGRAGKKVEARALFDQIVHAAWSTGDPGLVFLDRIAMYNPTPALGEMESTNPCGEQPLLPFESCNLGSLNLAKYVVEGQFEWERFRRDAAVATRFLDAVIDVNAYPVDECARLTRLNRKVGLGVMGLADALILLGLRYDSEDARAWAERCAAELERAARAESHRLAREKGPFAGFRDSMWARLGYPPLRNATLTTVAPTGTISILAGCSSGIEPVFAAVTAKNVLAGKRLVDQHPLAGRPAWRVAQEISVADHIKMQAVFQRHSDSAVSKTINLPKSATEQDVARAYFLAYESGCKGITVYRDQSRPKQVLENANGQYCVDC